MRKLLFVGIMIFCVSFVHAQEDDYQLKETVIKGEQETYDNIDYLEKNYGHLQPGEIIKIDPDIIQKTEEPQVEEVEKVGETQSTPKTESTEPSRKATSSGSSRSSSARKSSSRKRSKRKKISLKRKRPNKIKRKRKMGNRAACPSF